MRNEKKICFKQSAADFPLTVSLDNRLPEWSLSRWGGNRGLRFVPPDDEGFTLRGDKHRLLCKGRRRSHRFTILGDGAFEYDCILNREPENNVISLLIEGAERFDFFRQPDFVKDPFLKGSYAVYKKETLLGEGTGKLCHIHRPEIIDARGRRCWGELSVVGNRLCITIPEKWLSEAKYPVIVDPVVGTVQIGSQTPIIFGTDYNNIQMTYQYGVNRFFVPEKLAGTCTAHIYLNESPYGKGNLNPLLFDDINGVPKYRRSQNEEWISTKLWHYGPNNERIDDPPHWQTAGFSVIDNVQGGSSIWFGAYAEGFVTNFDYGGTYYKNFQEEVWIREPEEYYDEEEDEWFGDDGEFYITPDFPIDGQERVYNYLLSWYFEFESQSKNYVRTITQGVTLSDSRKLTGEYKRGLTQTAGVNSLLGRFQIFYRNIQEIVKGTDNNFSLGQFLRSLCETLTMTETIRHLGAYYRGLFDNAEADGEVKAGWVHFTKIADTVHAAGAVFRGVIFLVRIITGAFVRDYLLGRFLKARSELEIKSIITREIVLESKIN
jgi:hypothetical protein